MEEHLYQYLAGLASFPVAWGRFEADATLPRASLFRVGGSSEWTLSGPGLKMTDVQIDCYGRTFAEAIEASRTVRAALDGYAGGPIQGVFLERVQDNPDEDVNAVDRILLKFKIVHTD